MRQSLKAIGFLLLSCFLISKLSAESLPGKGVAVYPVQSTIEEEGFQTLIVGKALTALGYEVHPIRKVDYDTAYSMVAKDDATFLAVNWHPLHSDKYQAAGGDELLYCKGHLVVGAIQGYMIDKKTADLHSISNISQLAEPKIARLFDANDDDKADLAGCNLGWGCRNVIEHQLGAFGLSGRITQHQSGYEELIENSIARYRAGKPILYYAWTPYWVNAVLKPGRDVIWLQVPFSTLPGERVGVDTALPNGSNYGFEMNSMRIVANRAFAEQNPVAAKLFEVMKLPIQDISFQNMKMREGERSSQEIERHVDEWIVRHQVLFDSWRSIAMTAKNQ